MRFYLLDRIEEIKYGDYIKAVKCITLADDVFNEHFPGYPVFPGSLILEGLAQLSGALFELTMKHNNKHVLRAILSMVNKMKFRKSAEPGDKINLSANIKFVRETSGIACVKAEIDNEVCAEGELTFVFLDIKDNDLDKKRMGLYKSCMKNTRIIK